MSSTPEYSKVLLTDHSLVEIIFFKSAFSNFFKFFHPKKDFKEANNVNKTGLRPVTRLKLETGRLVSEF